VLIASLTFNVDPDNRGEFVSAASHIMQALRWSSGCLGCRLVSDCENSNCFTLFAEWDNRTFLDGYLSSPQFQILEGTRYLLRSGPDLSIDEVVSRGRFPGPIRSLR
jgi:quinol monooxygenase YgiN